MIRLKSWAKSDIGQKRANNEDSFYQDDHLGLYLVADGMGGHKGGDEASKLAVRSAEETYTQEITKGLRPCEALEKSLENAALNVFESGAKSCELRGMGTTLSALAIKDDRAYISHIGDTRIYCIREHNIHQLTCDHSLVNEQVQAGIMSREEARVSSLRNIITRAIGHNRKINADHFSLPVKSGDIFLLCSDGLNNMLTDHEILSIINTQNIKQSTNDLIAKANIKGGDDNITVILVQIDS